MTKPERDVERMYSTPDVVEVDLKTNVERTLNENEVVQLRSGQGFGRKVSFKRG